MKHPEREEWILFIEGETSPDDRQRLEEHLATCPSCTEQVSAWQRSIKRLPAWQLEPVPAAKTRLPLAKWAAAAAVLIAVGFAAGRSSAPAVDTEKLRSEITASVTADVSAQVRKEMAEMTTLLQTSRTEDREGVLALIRDMQRQNGNYYLSLRRDLETLASTSEEEIRRAQQGIVQLSHLTNSKN